MGGFLNGAGSIRAYPHAENTGLVISDVAKIDIISENSKYLGNFLFFPLQKLFWLAFFYPQPHLVPRNVLVDKDRDIFVVDAEIKHI